MDFGATAATGYVVDNDTQITATAPAGTGVVDVTVTTAQGTSANTAADDYTYLAAPSVFETVATAVQGPSNGTSVTISRPDGTTDGDLLIAFVSPLPCTRW